MKAILLFPGQGSQFEGMGRILHDNFATARLCIEEASDTLQRDFKKLLTQADEATLAQTTNTQPALLVMGVATVRVLQQESDLQIQSALGHSVGEYAALVSTQALPFNEALKAVQHRSQWMQEAVPLGQGGMLAVMGLENQQVEKLCQYLRQHESTKSGATESTTASRPIESDQKQSVMRPAPVLGAQAVEAQDLEAQNLEGQVLEAANFNAPGQVVISGHKLMIQNLLNLWAQNKQSVLEALRLEGRQKIRFIELKVSAPFHCSLMQGVEEKMRSVLEACAWQDAQAPVVQNAVAQPVQKAAQLCENLIQQISRPVLWAQSLSSLQALPSSQDLVERSDLTGAHLQSVVHGGVERHLGLASEVNDGASGQRTGWMAIECGPGRVLAGLAKKNLGTQLNVQATNTLDDIKTLQHYTLT